MKIQLPTNTNKVLLAAVGILVLAIIATIVWTQVHLHTFEERAAQYPLIDPARNFIPQEHFIVNIQPLRDELNAIVKREGADTVSVYFEFLNTGANAQVNPDLRAWPASLPKVPMAMAVLKKIEDGEWSLESELVLFEQDKDMKYGDLWENPVGTRFTIEELLREMLTKSDNTAYRMLLRNVGFDELTNVIAGLGLEDMFAEEGTVSAKEFSRLFRSLYSSSYLRRTNSEQLLEWLAESEFNGFLASGVPAETEFAHKFGIERDQNTYLDSGIVYVPNRPYLISVAIQGSGEEGEEERVAKVMQEISERIYTYVIAQ